MCLIHPVGHKHVGIPAAAIVAVGAEDQLFAIGGKHGKGVENTFRGDLFQTGTVFVDHVQLEIVPPFGVMVAGKDDFFAGRMEKRRPVGFAEVGYLMGVGTVGVADKNFHTHGRHETLFQ